MSGFTGAGIPSVLWGPQDQGFAGWSYDPEIAAGASNIPAAGTIQCVRIKVIPGVLISNLWLGINSPGATLTAGQNFAILYNDAATTLLGQTVDQSTAWTSGFTPVKMPITPVNAPGQYVRLAWYWNGTTGPKFQWASSSNLVNANLVAATARFATGGAGFTSTPPASLTLALTADAYWGGLSL